MVINSIVQVEQNACTLSSRGEKVLLFIYKPKEFLSWTYETLMGHFFYSMSYDY